MNNKIGVGVITCNREDFFQKCLNSIPEVDEIVVVNDGLPYNSNVYSSKVKNLIQHTSNKSVGVSKNEALRYLIQNDCQHLFLIEDDMLIKDPKVFETYIHTAEGSGIWHLNFAYHGPANFKPNEYGTPNPRQIVEYNNGFDVGLNPNCVGSFSYYLKGIIKQVGYIDERFQNAWEHVEHTNRIIKLGLHPPFWWFADVVNSYDFIAEQASSEVNSTIRKTPEWIKNMQLGMGWYEHKHGTTPQKTPDTPVNKVMEILTNIEKQYARKVI